AASLSSSIHAKAFTHGNDIYFNQGQFSPNTSEGQKLMAHELTHVVQGTGKVGRDDNDSSEVTTNNPSEKDYYNVLSAENLLILNMLTYLPHRNPSDSSNAYIRKGLIEILQAKSNTRMSVMDVIDKLEEEYDSPDKWNYEEDETISARDWKNIFYYIKNNDLFKHIIIKDARTDNYNDDSYCKEGCDNQYKEKQFSILFYNELSKEAIVAFRGTGLREWKDNFSGALNKSTVGQEKALERYQKYIHSLSEYSHITVTGHSKGGNKAKYITVKDKTVDRCVSFDGQGFSDVFINEYNDSIKKNWGKIVNYNTDKDFVNIILNDIGNTYYLKSQNYDPKKENEEDSFIEKESHSPEVMLNFIGHSAQLAEVGKIDDKMVALDKFLNSYVRTLSKCEFTDEKMKISDKDKKASVILIGELVEAIMNSPNLNIMNIMSFLVERVRRYNGYRRCLAFLLAFIYSYMHKNEEFRDMIPFGKYYGIIPSLPLKIPNEKFNKMEEYIINNEDINNYINYFEGLEFDDGGDIVLSN
ncbi:MAG: DUF2974 domain-containing protein, partial [Paludibacteraceae bacterium]|nr:DUF2974 domain-containing protein [Paludibacteraceae bacterium]